MEKTQLNAMLQQLHEELLQRPQIDESTQQSLRQLARDISSLLEPGGEAVPSRHRDLRERLAEKITDFDIEHPTLSRTLIDISNMLARMGI